MEIEYDELDEERIPWHPAFVEALQKVKTLYKT